jgi:hypothetical protein
MAQASAATKTIAPEQDDVYSRLEEARAEVASLEGKRKKLDAKLAGMSGERQQYELLDRICESLEKLDQMGAAHLFWGETQSRDSADQVVHARAAATAFVQKIRDIEQESAALLDRIREEEWKIVALTDEIVELEEEEEAARNEFVVVRDVADMPYRPMVMPWQGQAEDERRFRKSLSAALLIVLCLAVIVKLWIFPSREEQEVVEIPKQLVRLVQTEHPKPPPVEKQPEQKESEASKDTSKATTAEKRQARAKAMKSGVLAFKEGFSDLMQDSASLKLGADARINTKGQLAAGPGIGTRSLVVAQAQSGGSGGINTATLSRGVGVGGGGAGRGITGVGFTRVQSGVADMKGQSDRPLSAGPGPSRTDEEIQIVFDRYKAALYRMYQHELRSDPTLRGKMVLRITIEPNGSVSSCVIQSSDLASATLKNEVVERVKKFNFGAKDGVPRIAILYPIDFLPAS